ncbi:unnamed protein product, partial [Heterosigma akashiwo]
ADRGHGDQRVPSGAGAGPAGHTGPADDPRALPGLAADRGAAGGLPGRGPRGAALRLRGARTRQCSREL